MSATTSLPAAERQVQVVGYRLRRTHDPRRLRAGVRNASGETEHELLPLAKLEDLQAEWLALPGTPTHEQALVMGGTLYRLALGWSRLARTAFDAGPVELRVQLDASVAGLPWELLVRKGRFLALRFGTRIVRCVRTSDGGVGSVPAKWRVLVACAAPDDHEAGMRSELQGALDAQGLEVSVQATTSLADLQRRLSSAAHDGHPFDLLHLAVHGARGGAILLEDLADDAGRAVSAAGLAEILLAASPLHAVVTTACWGGTPLGLASALAARGVPEVVGLTQKTPVDDAVIFAGAFYGALAQGGIARAVAAGRQALLGSQPESVAWAQVVHHSSGHATDGQPEGHERRGQPSDRGGNVVHAGRDAAGRDLNKNRTDHGSDLPLGAGRPQQGRASPPPTDSEVGNQVHAGRDGAGRDLNKNRTDHGK